MEAPINISELEWDELEQVAAEIEGVITQEYHQLGLEGIGNKIINCISDFTPFVIGRKQILTANDESRLVCVGSFVKDCPLKQMCRIVGLSEHYAFTLTGTFDYDEMEMAQTVDISTVEIYPFTCFQALLRDARQNAAAELIHCSIVAASKAYQMPSEDVVKSIRQSVHSIPEIKSYLDHKKLTNQTDIVEIQEPQTGLHRAKMQ